MSSNRVRTGGSRVPSWADSLGVAVLSLIGAVLAFQLWRVPFDTPVDYGGDGNYYLMIAQGLKRHGSFLTNPDLGFPYGQAMYDVPEGGDILHWTVLRLLVLGLSAGAAVKVFFLLTFPAIGVTSHLVLRRLGVRRVFAAAAALLYVFLPYHLQRRTSHLMLSSYFLVPVAVLIALMILSERPPLTRLDRSSRWWVAAGCIGLACTGTYYAVFAVLLFLMSGAAAGLARRVWIPVRSAVTCAALVFAMELVNISPTLWYWVRHGSNPRVIHRRPQETEILGLRIQQLFAPRWDHRNSLVRKYAYWAFDGPVRSEGMQSLAVLGGLALFWLLARTVLRLLRPEQSGDPTDAVLDRLGFLALMCLLIGTGGGFGFFLSTFGLRQIRAYNRLSVVIAFCALAAASLALTRWLERRSSRRGVAVSPRWLVGLTALALCVAAYDQTSPRDSVRVSGNSDGWERDARFFATLGSAVPQGSAVLEVPMITFPEYPGLERMGSYDPGRGYLHQPGLKWSFGAVYGRVPENPPHLNGQPGEEVLAFARQQGFRVILVDRFGFPEGAAEAFEQRIVGAGAVPGSVSEDSRFAWYDLGAP